MNIRKVIRKEVRKVMDSDERVTHENDIGSNFDMTKKCREMRKMTRTVETWVLNLQNIEKKYFPNAKKQALNNKEIKRFLDLELSLKLNLGDLSQILMDAERNEYSWDERIYNSFRVGVVKTMMRDVDNYLAESKSIYKKSEKIYKEALRIPQKLGLK